MFSFFKKSEIDEISFNNSEGQQKYINEHIGAFYQARANLLAIDRQIGLAEAIDSILFLTGFIGLTSTVALKVGIYVCATQYFHRKDLALQHEASLQKLLEIYNWCLSGEVKNLPKNASFLKLLAAIAPFVETSELKIHLLNIKTQQNLSNEFIEILSRPPHCIQIISPQEPTISESKTLQLFEQFALPQINTAKKFINNKFLRLFPHLSAEANRAAYGTSFNEPLSAKVGSRVN